MLQLLHTAIVVLGAVTALVAVLLAIPSCSLRDVVFRVGEWVIRHHSE